MFGLGDRRDLKVINRVHFSGGGSTMEFSMDHEQVEEAMQNDPDGINLITQEGGQDEFKRQRTGIKVQRHPHPGRHTQENLIQRRTGEHLIPHLLAVARDQRMNSSLTSPLIQKTAFKHFLWFQGGRRDLEGGDKLEWAKI
jgi:hypothetical protein